jgi:CRP-like cAMP-binding protein
MDLLEVFEGSEDRQKHELGSIIFEEGNPGELMYVVLNGEVLLSYKGQDIATVSRGAIVGEMALLNSDVRSATATAVTDCVLAPIDVHSFKSLIQHTPDFALHVMNVLADRLRLANEAMARIASD